MKIYCEACNGSGAIFIRILYEYEDCPECNGKGYTENETIEHEARVGRATMMWFENDLSMYDTENDVAIHNVESLVDWAESGEI